MSNLTSFDWWIGLYFVASGVAVAFTIGQSLVKLLLLRFANRKRIDDTLWCLGSLLEQRYGELKEGATLCIKAKRFMATIQRTQDEKPVLIKKQPEDKHLASQRTEDRGHGAQAVLKTVPLRKR